MSESRDRSTRRLKESLGKLAVATKQLALTTLRWAYWTSGAARDDPHLQGAIRTGYWQGIKSKLEESGWGKSDRPKKPGEDLPS